MTYTPPEGVTIGTFTADTLPASFNAPAGAEISYKIYGTEAGVGTATSEEEPAGYKITLTVNDTPTPIYIGESKLGSDEYVYYQDRKIYKLKEVHEDTVTIDGVVWDILGYDHDETYDGEGNLARHSVTIQMRDIYARMAFSNRQALFAFPNGLTSGTYYFTVGMQPWYSADVNKVITFTTTQDIPANGQFVLNGSSTASFIGATISSYESPASTTPIETITMSEAASTPIGTNLGTVNNAINGEINSIQRAYSNTNRWKDSSVRQLLNSDATVGNVWTPQTAWDRPPSWNGTRNGFLYNASASFKASLGITKKTTVKNSICDGGGNETTEDKVFLLSRSEVYGDSTLTEGNPYDYYKDYSDLSSAGTGNDTNRVKSFSGTDSYWFLRSCVANAAANVSSITSTGQVAGTRDEVGLSPAVCIPLDNINNDSYLQSLFLKSVDPPIPFPIISTYQGDNTISSTETLGDVEFTGEWTAIMGSTEDESIDIDFTVDADSYIAFVTVDDDPSIQVFDTITMPASAGSFTLQVVSWGREQYTDTVYNALS